MIDDKKYITWLNNAYAMETEILELLDAQIKDARDEGKYDTLVSKLEEHRNITKDQAEKVKGLIEKNGGNISEAKELVEKIMGNTKGVMMEMMQDKILKNTIAAYSVENLEIATYLAILTMAEVREDDDTIETISYIIQQEEDMANWITDNIETVIMPNGE